MLGHQPHGMCAVGPMCNFAQLIMAKAMRCLEGEFKEPEWGLSALVQNLYLNVIIAFVQHF
jgi:hypothetical protein